MQKGLSYTKGEAKSRMTFAFMLYLERGLEAVKGVYPEHYEFVVGQKDKTLAEVRQVISNILYSGGASQCIH